MFRITISKVGDIVTDPFGRYVIVILTIDNTPHTFVAIYIPPPFTIALWDAIMAKVLQVARDPIIMVGDVNAVLLPEIDFKWSLNVLPHWLCVWIIRVWWKCGIGNTLALGRSHVFPLPIIPHPDWICVL